MFSHLLFPRTNAPKHRPPPPNKPGLLSRLWPYLCAIIGFGFGLIGDARPFGRDILAHPAIVMGVVIGLILIAARLLLKRPIPEVMSDMVMKFGFAVAIFTYLAGTFLASRFGGIVG